MTPVALVLKITLRGLRPPVWRRVRVAANSSLRMLHLVVQAAMGWQDYHLHEFEIGDRRYGEPDDDPWPGDQPTFEESNLKLGALIERGVERFRYVYDFGDGWEHEIVVEKVEPLDSEQPYPSLITGKRACPPEDCGGVHGYLRLLEVLADPAHEEHAELREWAGDLNPEQVDLDAIRRDLACLARRLPVRGLPGGGSASGAAAGRCYQSAASDLDRTSRQLELNPRTHENEGHRPRNVVRDVDSVPKIRHNPTPSVPVARADRVTRTAR